MPAPRPSRTGGAGFTLIETLAALAIVGMAAAAIAGVFGSGLLGHQVSDQVATALSLAETQMAAAGITEPLSPQQKEGVFAARFHWRLAVSPYDEPQNGKPPLDQSKGPLRLYRIAIAVDWREGWRQREISLDTLRLGPAPP